jgi:hypothetical protein
MEAGSDILVDAVESGRLASHSAVPVPERAKLCVLNSEINSVPGDRGSEILFT